MAITKEFKDAVQNGKLLRVRIILKDSLLIDPTSAQFDEMADYAERVMGNLYVEHNGEVLNYDITSWNKDYLNNQMVQVVNNFSKERINLLKSMVRTLYKEKAAQTDNLRYETRPSQGSSTRQMATGVTITGAAVAIAGICTSQTLLAVGGVAVTIAGVALIITDKGNDR